MKKFVFLFCIIILLTGCQKTFFSKNIFYMDTIINLKIYDEKEKEANKAFEEIEKIFQKYQKIADNYDTTSEIYKINHSPNSVITISSELNSLLEFGLKWGTQSNNLLNINMGALTLLWSEARKTGILPETDLLNTITFDEIKLDSKQITTTSSTNIDLGSITKGYVTELAGEYLENIGINSYIINAGGNVKVGSSNKGYFNVGIMSPNDNSTFKIIKAQNTSVVTSGGYERFFEYEGKKYHHIIDPNTKYPANYIKSVTIIGKDSGIGDALSTILFLMDIETGKQFIKEYDVDVIWYTNDDKIITNDGFKYE